MSHKKQDHQHSCKKKQHYEHVYTKKRGHHHVPLLSRIDSIFGEKKQRKPPPIKTPSIDKKGEKYPTITDGKKIFHDSVIARRNASTQP